MTATITRDEVKRRKDSPDTVIVDVLAPEDYTEYHIPGAINVPLDEQFEEEISTAVPDKDKTVIVYCMSADCDASSKAAQRLESLGYSHVLDYESGKQDWKRAGLPIES